MRAGRAIERGLEVVRLVVPVQPQGHIAALVEKQDRRGELHLEPRGELLLRSQGAVGPRDLAIAPDIERERHEVLLRFPGDLGLPEIHFQEPLAIRAAILAEVEEHALLLRRGFGDVLA